MSETAKDISGLKGKTVLVTGGNSGIGRACAIAFAEVGANIMIAARRYKLSEAISSELNLKGYSSAAVSLDVSDYNQAVKAAEITAEKFGSIDIIINNAGITADAFTAKMTKEQWDSVINVNLSGAFYCIKAVLPYMLEQGFGRIINMTSVAARKGAVAQANYAASKAGLIGMTLSLAQELGPKNITVNAIAPGYVSTDMTEKIPEKIKQRAIEIIPEHRFGAPEEIASAAVFLAGKGGDYCNGTILDVNGGVSI